MLSKGAALNICFNAGQGEELEAWRLLVARYEPKNHARFASQLVRILGWSFDTDPVAQVEGFEREIAVYELGCNEKLSDGLKGGIVLRHA
eukprot:6428391-Amphidinium_carterae.1